jgi:hypothetical protein
MEARINTLMDAIRSSFATRCLAVIIDDVWDLSLLDRLGLARVCTSAGKSSGSASSSLMVTSRVALPASSLQWYQGFSLTGESNRAQALAILASYAAAHPEVDTVQPHLKVQL